MRQRFIFGGDMNLRLETPAGPALGAITVVVLNADGSNAVTSGVGALDGVEQIATSSPAVGEKTVTVPAAALALNRAPVWIGDFLTGPLELSQVLSVASNVITLVEPLRYAHTTPGVASGVITRNVTSEALAEGVYQTKWTWKYPAAGGELFQARTMFRVGKSLFMLPVTMTDVRRHAPQGVRIGASDFIVEDLVVVAQQQIETELERQNLRPDLVMDPDQFRMLGAIGVNSFLLERQVQHDGAFAEAADRLSARYWAEWGRLLAARQFWYDSDNDEDLTDEDQQGGRIWMHEEQAPP